MRDGLELGKEGELRAKRFLQGQGYKIISSNYRCRYGEIDIVCEHQGTIVFVEVKTRSSNRFGTPAEAVTFQKRRRLYQLAQAFLIDRNWEGKPVRFDVLGLTKTGDGLQIEHFVGAF